MAGSDRSHRGRGGCSVVGIYANVEGLTATVLGTDTDDCDQEAEIKEEVQELERRIAVGELHQIN